MTGDNMTEEVQHRTSIPTKWEQSYINAHTRAFDNPPLSVLSYRNAAIIMLLHTYLLLNWVRDIHPQNHKCDEKDMGLLCAFWRLSTFYWLGDPARHTHEIYVKRVWDKLCATRWNMDANKEQESWRFLREFFYQVYAELGEDSGRQNEIHELFSVHFKTRRICQNCKRESPLKHEPVSILEASFKKAALGQPSYKVARAIRHRQQLGIPTDGDPAWGCGGCSRPDGRNNSLNPISPLKYIISLPEVLFVRVEHTDSAGRTLGMLELEDTLTVPANWQYHGTPRQDVQFELYSIIFHWAHDKNNGTVVQGDHNVCAAKEPRSTDKWALAQSGQVFKDLSLDDLLVKLDKNQRPVLLAYRRLPLIGDLTKPTIDPRVLMKQTISVREGVEWNFENRLAFPVKEDRLIKLDGKSRTHRAKFNVELISETTGETLEGEATISLATKKRKRTEGSAVVGCKKRGRPLGSGKVAKAKVAAKPSNPSGPSQGAASRRPSREMSGPLNQARPSGSRKSSQSSPKIVRKQSGAGLHATSTSKERRDPGPKASTHERNEDSGPRDSVQYKEVSDLPISPPASGDGHDKS